MTSKPALLEPARLRARREARPLDDDDRAAVDDRDAELARGRDEHAAQVGAERVGGGDVGRLRAVVERVRATRGAVDELVADDEAAELEVGRSAPDAQGPRIRRTPSSRIAQTLARKLIRCGGSSCSRPWRGMKATRCPPSSATTGGADGAPVRRLDLDLLGVRRGTSRSPSRRRCRSPPSSRRALRAPGVSRAPSAAPRPRSPGRPRSRRPSAGSRRGRSARPSARRRGSPRSGRCRARIASIASFACSRSGFRPR